MAKTFQDLLNEGQAKVLGIVSIVPMDDWNTDTQYQKLNLVRHNGAAYLAKGGSKNVEPGVTQDWQNSWMLVYLDGILSPDGTYPNLTAGRVMHALAWGNKNYDGSSAQTITAADLGLADVYKPQGSIAYSALPATPSADNYGYVWNITDDFTTDSRFIEGAGKSYSAGTNVGVIEQDSAYYYDIFGAFIDLSNYATVEALNAEITRAKAAEQANAIAASKAQSTANSKYTKPSSGIPKSDLAQSVQDSLDKADQAATDIASIKDGTTVVGRAKNVIAQIDGHDISDIFETDGTTVKNATQAQGTEQLTVPMPLGNGTDAVINGYYKIASAEIASSSWGEATAFFFISSPNRANNFKDSCLIQCTFRGQGTAESQVYVALLAGSREFLERLYISYVEYESTLPFNADLYLYTNNQSWQDISIKLLYSTNRLGNTIDIWTVPKTNPTVITSLPSGAVNTQLSSIVNLITEAGTANSLTAVQIPNNADLNDYVGSEYWGKVFYAVGGNTVANKPPEAVGFNLEVKQGGNNTTIQILRARNQTTSSNAPTTWQRAMDTVVGGVWSNWEEVVTADGSYPTLGAGYLPNNYIYAGGSSDPKWYKIATISNAPNFAAAGLLLSINGIFATQDNQYGAETGQIEFDAANASGTYSCSATLNYGNINTNNVCVVQNGSTAELYYHFDSNYQAILVTVMSFYGGSTASYELTNEGVSSAPSNAVYAVNRNIAAEAENVTSKINGIAITSIFTTDGTAYKAQTAEMAYNYQDYETGSRELLSRAIYNRPYKHTVMLYCDEARPIFYYTDVKGEMQMIRTNMTSCYLQFEFFSTKDRAYSDTETLMTDVRKYLDNVKSIPVTFLNPVILEFDQDYVYAQGNIFIDKTPKLGGMGYIHHNQNDNYMFGIPAYSIRGISIFYDAVQLGNDFQVYQGNTPTT